MWCLSSISSSLFLSTPSARRATSFSTMHRRPTAYFYPRPPRGGRPVPSSETTSVEDFYPRPPRGGRLGDREDPEKLHQISIHALREEGDCRRSPSGRCCGYFYPRPPRGGRRRGLVFSTFGGGDFYPRPPRGGRLPPWIQTDRAREFLSTPSARRATKRARHDRRLGIISIHALREEGDLWPTSRSRPSTNFYPRPPRGGRRFSGCGSGSPRRNFYPRPPRGGRRQKQRQNLYFQTNYTTFCTNLEEL